MWRNTDVQEFVDWLHDFNSEIAVEKRIGFYGLDVYSLYASVREVVKFLEDNDPVIADVARKRYACLSPWETDPAAYGYAAIIGRYKSCEKAVLDVLLAMLQDREKLIAKDEAGFFNAVDRKSVV